MPKLIVTTQTGEEVTIAGQAGASVMQSMRDGGISDLLALCGGCCSCATCHVWVDPAFIDKLPKASEEEVALLEDSSNRKATSRLSCQIRFADNLDGLRVTLAPDE